MRFINLFFILFALASFGGNAMAEKDLPGTKLKIKKPEATLRVPADAYFFDVHNKKYFFEDFDGKTIILAFWATWCAPCIKELPELDILKKDFRKLPIEIIALSEDFQGPQLVKEFYQNNDIKHLDIFHDYGNSLFRALNVSGLPTTFIIDPDGIIQLVIEGGIRWNQEEMRNMLLEYIAGNPILPQNSSSSDGLNQTVKTPLKKEDLQDRISTKTQESTIGEVINSTQAIVEKPDKEAGKDHGK